MNKYLIGAIALLIVALSFIINKNASIKSERDRLYSNQSTLFESVKHYKHADSLNAISVGVLQLKVSELKNYRSKDAELIKELKLRPKDVEYITTTEIVTRDSLVYVIDSVGCFRYHNKWLRVDACIGDSSIVIESRDSIAQVLHRIPKHRFLWWKWGTKGVRQEVINFNPHGVINYSEVLKLN